MTIQLFRLDSNITNAFFLVLFLSTKLINLWLDCLIQLIYNSINIIMIIIELFKAKNVKLLIEFN